jgi:serine protease Do
MGLQPGELAGVEWYDAGIGFAIPYSVAGENIELLRQGTEIERGYIGIEMADTPEPGVLIRRIPEDSPAESVGLLAGDRVVGINGNPVRSRLDLLRNLNVQAAGHQIEIVVQRDGERIPVSLTLGRFDDIGFDRFVQPAPPSPETQPAELPERPPDAPLPDGQTRPE